MRRELAVFLGVAFGVSWALGLGLFWLGPGVPLGVQTALMVLYMFGPLLGAVVAQKVRGERPFGPLGVGLRPNRWWLVAWLLPFVLVAVGVGLALSLPGVHASPRMDGFFERLAETLPPAQLEQARRQMAQIPPAAYWAMLVVQPLVAGVSVNALAAFGEELGWRGFLFRQLAPWGFWWRSLAVGLLWGTWHAPLILQGHNYPQHPVAGVFLMMVFCVLFAPLLDWVRLRGGSVWTAAILHGTFNATAGFGIMFLRGGNDLTVGVTGLSGLGALLLADVTLWWVDRARGGALLAPDQGLGRRPERQRGPQAARGASPCAPTARAFFTTLT